jgi:hypothetical protein
VSGLLKGYALPIHLPDDLPTLNPEAPLIRHHLDDALLRTLEEFLANIGLSEPLLICFNPRPLAGERSRPLIGFHVFIGNDQFPFRIRSPGEELFSRVFGSLQ